MYSSVSVALVPHGHDVLQTYTGSMRALKESLGAILIGSLFAMFLSGTVMMQTFLYFRLYPKDRIRVKLTVAVVCLTDSAHTILTCVADWVYLVKNFGNFAIINVVIMCIAITVALTAVITFLVQCFFIHRIHTLSHGKHWITLPLAFLSAFRLVAAFVSMGEMIRLKTFSGFVSGYSWVFTMGLATAAFVDILITIGLCYNLRKGRTGFSSMDKIVDSITLYTVENGLLTSVTTLVSLICWVTMPHNLIFLGLHLAISKIYANAFLATLNARKALVPRSEASQEDYPLPVRFPESFSRRYENDRSTPRTPSVPAELKLSPTDARVHATVDSSEGRGAYGSSRSGQDDSDGSVSKFPTG